MLNLQGFLVFVSGDDNYNTTNYIPLKFIMKIRK